MPDTTDNVEQSVVSLVKPEKPALSIAEQVKIIHSASPPPSQAKKEKPRKGDIIGFLDKDGEVVETGTAARKADIYTSFRSDLTGRTRLIYTDILIKIEPNVWIYKYR